MTYLTIKPPSGFELANPGLVIDTQLIYYSFIITNQPSKHVLVLKTSWRRLPRRKIVTLKTSWRPVLKMSWRHILKTSRRRYGDKENTYWIYLYLTNLNEYLTNLYFTNLYLTILSRIQNALIRTQEFHYSSYFGTQAASLF